MEEEVGIKVTRLRRRLSVEAEDVKSPSTQSTPTKKRGGRLAAKPQLELIDENAPDAAPKKTRKSTVKEVEPVEEKAITPSRRSTRIKSNTSIVSETPGDVAEDKGTPSRRSTRIRSNTSLIAEPANVNSPRAKRAARRTSLVGSDNEAPITPARNNSTSSIDKPVEPAAGKLGAEIKEVIVEESENNVKETPTTETSKNDSSSVRKSPRLVGKSGRKSSSLDNENKENEPRSDKEAGDTTAAADKSVSEPNLEQTTDVIDQKASDQVNLSATSKNLIQELQEAPKKAKSIFNKSTTAVEESQIKTKRNRTKSWTTISVESPQETSFCSDSEVSNKNNKKKDNSLNFSNISGSGDGIMNTSNKNNEGEKGQDNVYLNSSTLSNKKKKKRHEMSMTNETETSVHELSVLNTSVNKSATKLTEVKDGSEEINNLNSPKQNNTSVTQKLFEQAPSGVVQALVFIEDSDSNQEKENDKGFDSGDQCVPVVIHPLQNETAKETKVNLSYEPMDIDETMPENVSLTNFEEENESASEKGKSILHLSQVKNDSLNKSKRKSLENNIDEASSKSPRKSSISEAVNNGVGDNNKSKRKSSITNEVSEDTTDGIVNVSNRNSSAVVVYNHDDSINNNKKANKSKRKSSISNVVTENNTDEDSNNSARKSLNAEKSNDSSITKESNKSKRKSSISFFVTEENANEISNKSKSTSSDLAIDENMDKSLNKSKRKSSVTAMVVEHNTDKIKTSILDDNEDMINKSSNKSKRKSSISNMPNEDSINNSSDKSKNKSALYLDKTENENKSTLVLSQLKDVSENEINAESNVAKDDSNEQLSKSVNVPNVVTEKDDKKNLSLTYSTSTPLQQKSMKKLGLQINTSIITPNSANKTEKKENVNRSNKEASITIEEEGSDSSEAEEDTEEDAGEESEEESLKKSKMIDDEAEEASDDYESGDSRDEEEREYEEENMIKEKGETLDSDEEEFSDDSDYEKDSFLVSSDEEDKDLLSGSGDDLSMSADELTMTAKSKKKFNERKIKEQKKASREMYEARHNLNVSNKRQSPKSKQNSRQRFDTSSSESDDEVTAKPKKNRRQRIDSSHDASALQSETDKSLLKKKKTKRLSESDGDETNEKEITIRDDNQTDKNDPLTLLNVIKEEPKTPQKRFNISTVAVTNMVEVEEVNVDENTSIMKSNQTADPLQATIIENDEEDISDEGSISENEEISRNYESVLNNLNKSGSKKIKASNISLDLDKKTKQKSKEPILDELNLTQVKKSKKNKDNADEIVTETKKQNKTLNNSVDKVTKPDTTMSEGSSDSIDMKLLFPEDSNDSEVVTDKKKQAVKETSDKEDNEEAPGEYIPLKRTPGKTNIFENTDIANKSKDESMLNVSGKKKNKRKSFQSQETLEIGTAENENLGFFIDTTGTLTDENKTDVNISIKNSAKKNKQKNNVSFTGREEIPLDDDSNEAPLEVSYRSEKNKSTQDLNTTQNNEGTQDNSATVGTPNQSAKKKKKNKGLNSSQNVAEITVIETADDVAEKSINVSGTNLGNSGKKKKNRLSDSQIATETEIEKPTDIIQNISLGSAKKQKQRAVSENNLVETENVDKENEVDAINQDLVAKKRKRKSSANQTIEEIIIKDDVKLTHDESILTKNQKKKRKISNNDEDKTRIENEATETQEQEITTVENTKKKNKVQCLKVNEIDEVSGAIKKNKKRKERDDDDASKISKVLKQNSFDKVHVPRLPPNVIKQLDDKPKKDVVEAKKTKIVSTSEFVVEETKRRRNKPSNYLEESVYCINDDMDEKKQKRSIKNPKVLPFIPTASTSDSGFTTKFKVNVISQQTQFVAQSSDISNFKNDYLLKKRIKKLGTFEMYKRQRNIKIAKF